MDIQVYNWLNIIPNTLYPPRCLLCGAPGEGDRDLCEACADALPHNRHPCAICALPLPSAAPTGSICGHCSRKQPAFDRCYAALVYGDLSGPLISRLKFHRRLSHARLLSSLMIEYIERQQPFMPNLLLPVPLHRRRLKDRGYNQALEIARPLARYFQLDISSGLCRRTENTAAQSGLNRKAREKNLRHAFSLMEDVTGRHITLVDDVVTTGTTVAELARCLKRGGATRVDVWAVARTPTYE